MKQIKKLLPLLLIVALVSTGTLSAQNWKKLANKAKNKVIQSQQKKQSNSTINRSNVNRAQNTSNSTNSSTQQNQTKGGYDTDSIATWASYFKAKNNVLSFDLMNLTERTWTLEDINTINAFNFPEVKKNIFLAAKKYPDVFAIYLGNIPKQADKPWGITRDNYKNIYPDMKEYGTDVSPVDIARNKNLDRDYVYDWANFLNEYYNFMSRMKYEKDMVVKNLRELMIKTDQRRTLDGILFLKKYYKTVEPFYPGDEMVKELGEEIDNLYDEFMINLKADGTITGKFHSDHLQEIVFFGKKPNIGHENEADLITEVTPTKPAYVTGYFSTKLQNKMPVLRLIEAKGNNFNDPGLFLRGGYVEIMLPVEPIVSNFKGKSYLYFNLFPDINTVKFESHYRYLLNLNIIKWMKYLPVGKHEYFLQFSMFGLNKDLALGKITFNITKESKQQMKEYYDKLYDKYLHALYYPSMAGCEDAKGKIVNLSDLSKYGKVLRVTLKKAGDIMKPWPNDDQVDWNTAFGYCAVEREDGTCLVLPIEFRKRPGASKWQWWSISGFGGEPIPVVNKMDIRYDAVKQTLSGYKILKENVFKCKKWY